MRKHLFFPWLTAIVLILSMTGLAGADAVNQDLIKSSVIERVISSTFRL